jgi:Dolichyl-phosphate-mannose-protein mannosyltransferase
MILFVLTRFAVISCLAVSAYGLGCPVLGRLRLDGRLERIALGAALGLGVLGTSSLVLGLLGVLTRLAVGGLAAAGVALALFSLRRRNPGTEKREPPMGWLRSATLAIGAAALAILFVRGLYPPTAFDATLYHLPMAKAYATQGRVAPNPDLRFPVFPALNETLFADAILLCDDVSAQLVETLLFGLLTAGVVSWATRAGGRAAGFWAVALWIANPVVFSLASVAYVDMGLAAFAFFSVYASARWLESKDPGWARVAGAFAGFAAATKYSGLFFLGLAAGALILRTVRRDATARREPFAFAAAASAAGGLWYILNWTWTGNPIWPFAGRIFGYRYWSPADVASLLWSLRKYGWGRSLLDFLLLPYRLIFEQPATEAHVLPLLFALFPLAAWAAIRRRELQWPAAVAAAYFVFWFETTQQVRFLLPVVPLLSVLGACGIAALVESARGEWRRRLRAAVTIGMAVFAAAALAVVFHDAWSDPSVPTTPAERERYLERLVSYPFYRDLNRQTHGRYSVYAFRDENMTYYCDGRHLGDWFGPNRYADAPLSTARALFDWLRQRGVSHLLVNDNARVRLPAGEDFSSLFERVYDRGPVTAYALRSP